QDPRQLDATALAAGEHADRQVDAVLAEPEPGGQRPRLALSAVAAVEPEPLLGPRIALDVALGRFLLHGDPQLLDPHDLLVDPATGQHVVDGGAPVEHAGDPR